MSYARLCPLTLGLCLTYTLAFLGATRRPVFYSWGTLRAFVAMRYVAPKMFTVSRIRGTIRHDARPEGFKEDYEIE